MDSPDQVKDVVAETCRSFAEEEQDRARSEYTHLFKNLSRRCESPIELLFLAAFIPAVLRGDGEYQIRPQAKIDGYRVDFAVGFEPESGYLREVIVECDGHDYHERTKDQAEKDKARDRAITASGLPVFRFTGRELYRDPDACVQEVVDYTQGPLLDSINAAIRGVS